METIIAIITAAAPILVQLAQLALLLVKAKERNLTIAEVQEEIDKILKRKQSQDAEEWAAAGLNPPG